jgi:hypothetical protein
MNYWTLVYYASSKLCANHLPKKDTDTLEEKTDVATPKGQERRYQTNKLQKNSISK